jgi:hypothetical protein
LGHITRQSNNKTAEQIEDEIIEKHQSHISEGIKEKIKKTLKSWHTYL